MNTKTRPVVYFPTMTDEELIAYAESYSETALEGELSNRVRALSITKDECLKEVADARAESYEEGRIDGYDDGYLDGTNEL